MGHVHWECNSLRPELPAIDLCVRHLFISPQLRNGILLALTLRSFPHLLKTKPWQGPRPGESKKAGNERTAVCSPDQQPPRAGQWELAPVDRCHGQRKGKGEERAESAQSKQAAAESSDHHWELSVPMTADISNQDGFPWAPSSMTTLPPGEVWLNPES